MAEQGSDVIGSFHSPISSTQARKGEWGGLLGPSGYYVSAA